MGIFGNSQVNCIAGEWTRIIFDFGKGYPETMTVELFDTNGAEVTAEYRETHYMWIFPMQPVTGVISFSSKFHRRWIDGIYSVYIKSNSNCTARII